MTIRYKPAKRAGGWGSLFFTLLGGKEGQVSKIVILTILIIVIIIMIIVITILIIVIIIMIIDGKVKWKVPNKAAYDYHFQSRIGKSMPGNKVEKTLQLTWIRKKEKTLVRFLTVILNYNIHDESNGDGDGRMVIMINFDFKDLNQETVPNIGDYYDSRIRKKENDRTMV